MIIPFERVELSKPTLKQLVSTMQYYFCDGKITNEIALLILSVMDEVVIISPDYASSLNFRNLACLYDYTTSICVIKFIDPFGKRSMRGFTLDIDEEVELPIYCTNLDRIKINSEHIKEQCKNIKINSKRLKKNIKKMTQKKEIK